MRKSHLVILPGARSLTQIGALLLFLACPNIAFFGRDRGDIQPSCSFSTMGLKWLQKKPDSEFSIVNNPGLLKSVDDLGKESVFQWCKNDNSNLTDFHENTALDPYQFINAIGGNESVESQSLVQDGLVLHSQKKYSQRLPMENAEGIRFDMKELNNNRRTVRQFHAVRSERRTPDKRTLTYSQSIPYRSFTERGEDMTARRIENHKSTTPLLTTRKNQYIGRDIELRRIDRVRDHTSISFNERRDSRFSRITRNKIREGNRLSRLSDSRRDSFNRKDSGSEERLAKLSRRIESNVRTKRDSRELLSRFANGDIQEFSNDHGDVKSSRAKRSERLNPDKRTELTNSRSLSARTSVIRRESSLKDGAASVNNRINSGITSLLNKNERFRRDSREISRRSDSMRDQNKIEHHRNVLLKNTEGQRRVLISHKRQSNSRLLINLNFNNHREMIAENEITRIAGSTVSPQTIRTITSRVSRNDILTNSHTSKLFCKEQNIRFKRLDNSLLQSRHLAQRISNNLRENQLRRSVKRDDRRLDSIISSQLSDSNLQKRNYRDVRGNDQYRDDMNLIDSDRQYRRFSHTTGADRLVRASSDSRLLSSLMEYERREDDSKGKFGRVSIRFDYRVPQSRESRGLTRMIDLFRDDLSVSIYNRRVSRLKRSVRISDDDKSSSIDYSRQMNRRMSMELRESKSRDELKRVASRVNSRISTRDDSRNTRALNELTRRASQLHKNDRRLFDYRRDSRMTNTERLAKFDTSAVSTSRLESRRLSNDAQESGDISKRISPINSRLTEISRDSDYSRRDFRDLSRRAAYFGDDMALILNKKSYSRSSSSTRREQFIRSTPSSQRSYRSQSLDNAGRISKLIDSRISFENEFSRRESRTVSRRTYLIREDISKSSDNRQVSDLLRANRNKRSVYEDSAVTSSSISRSERQDNFRRTNDRFSTRWSSSLGRTERNAFKSEALRRRTDLFRDDMAILSNERLTRRNGISLSVRESLSRRSADQYRLNTIVGSRRSSNSHDNSIFDSRNLNNRFDQFRDNIALPSLNPKPSKSVRQKNKNSDFLRKRNSRYSRSTFHVASKRINNDVDYRQSLVSHERDSVKRNLNMVLRLDIRRESSLTSAWRKKLHYDMTKFLYNLNVFHSRLARNLMLNISQKSKREYNDNSSVFNSGRSETQHFDFTFQIVDLGLRNNPSYLTLSQKPKESVGETRKFNRLLNQMAFYNADYRDSRLLFTANNIRHSFNDLKPQHMKDGQSNTFTVDSSFHLQQSRKISAINSIRRWDSDHLNFPRINYKLPEIGIVPFSADFISFATTNRTLDLAFIFEVLGTVTLIYLMATQNKKPFNAIDKFNCTIRNGFGSDILNSIKTKHALKC